jgi:pilus assembly protein CpaB
VYLYASKADARALAGQQPVEVLVAKVNIPAGTSATEAQAKAYFQKKAVARSAAVPTALSPDSLTSINGKVALAPIFAGEQILPAQFGDSGQASGLALPPGTLAVSVQVGDPARVAGLLRPGNDVAVFVTITPRTGSAAGSAVTRLLLPKARVVAIGSTTSRPAADQTATNGTATTNPLVTLALNQNEAQKLVFASQQGSVYFGLLTANSDVSPGLETNASNLFN